MNATYGLFALGDLVKGHEATAPLLALTCSMAAAALLPWGLTAQVATAVVTSGGNVVVQRLAGSPWEAMVDPAASVVAAQGVAVYVALELERFHSERRRAVSDLARANLVKTEFVSTMSHELRTPLNVIMGYTEMLDDPAYADPAYALGRIRQANTELLDVIEGGALPARAALPPPEAARAAWRLRDAAVAGVLAFLHPLTSSACPGPRRAEPLGLRLDLTTHPLQLLAVAGTPRHHSTTSRGRFRLHALPHASARGDAAVSPRPGAPPAAIIRTVTRIRRSVLEDRLGRGTTRPSSAPPAYSPPTRRPDS